MFCIRCGKEIPEKALFCPFCGEKQGEEAISEGDSEVSTASGVDVKASHLAKEGNSDVSKESRPVQKEESNNANAESSKKQQKKDDNNVLPEGTFLFGRYEVKVPTNARASLRILKMMQDLTSECKNDYIQFYTRCGSMEEIISSTPSKIGSYYVKMAEKVEYILTANKIMGVSQEDIIEYNRYSYKASSVLNNMKNAKGKLDKAKNNDYVYRQNRKNSRGKFVGGGFGLSGAVKGMAIAGAANMATGAMHDLFNVFGNAATKVAYDNKMRALKDSGYCGQMVAAIEADCFLFVDVLNTYMKKANKHLHYNMSSILESNKIIKQIEEGKVAKQNEMEVLCKAFLACPVNERFYELFCYKYTDKDGELIRCMEYFGLDTGQVRLIQASREYCNSYFGDKYIPLIRDELERENTSLEGFLDYFYDEEINPFLMEDINNVPHLFMDASADLLNNRAYCMTFDNAQNVHYLYQIKRLTGYEIDMNKEVPLLLIRLTGFSMESFILITSKYVILPGVRLKVHLIDEIEVERNAVIFCNKYSVKQNMFCKDLEQDDLLSVLMTVILYIQFAYNLNQEEKTIPLLGIYSGNEVSDPYDFLKEDYISAMAQYGYVSQYVASMFEKQNYELITVKNSASNMQFIQKELQKYQLTLQQERFVVMFISEEFFGGKNGIYITERNMYFHINESVNCLPIEQIEKFDYDENKGLFIINDSITINIIKDKQALELADHFMLIIHLLQQKLMGELKEVNTRDDKSESIDTDLKNDAVHETLVKIKKCCSEYKVSSVYDNEIIAGEFVGPERIKKFDEVSEAFELEASDEIFFYYNDSSWLSGLRGLILCSSGMRIVSKRGKFFYSWDKFKKLNIRYTSWGDGLYIDNTPLLPLTAEGKKTCKLLKDLQTILNSN